MSTDRAALLERAKQIRWWHAIDFGDAQSVGRDPPERPNGSLYGVMDMMAHVDFTGLDCLDIGTTDGLVAFHLKAKGARRVVATDRTAEPRDGFALARQLLAQDVEFIGDTDFENIIDRVGGEHQFDVIVCAGVMYHMLNPYDAVLKCRRLLKHDGVLFMQSYFAPNDDRAALIFNSVEVLGAELNTFWIPTAKALEGMLYLGGFDVLATRTVTVPAFHAAVCRNAPLEEITNAPGMIQQQHAEAMRPREMAFTLPEAKSAARYTGPRNHLDIVATAYEPNFQFQPAPGRKGLGEAVIKQFGKKEAP